MSYEWLDCSEVTYILSPTWSYFWRKNDVREYCEKHFGSRVIQESWMSAFMHPVAFTVPSIIPNIVERSIEEFEYHVDVARWMGYGKQFQDFKCNVHIIGLAKVRSYTSLPIQDYLKEARNIITIENDEMSGD